VIAEPRTNQLFVTDIASAEQVQQLIAKLDVPVRQVLIEARIVEASDTFGKSLGVRSGRHQPAAASRWFSQGTGWQRH
jgi:type IV pilus assembly protein PilQ